MDIGFETIIYIVLGLVFVFAQIAKSKKKAAAAQVAEDEYDEEGESPSPTSFFEQLLGAPEQNPLVEKPVDNFIPPREIPDSAFHQPSPGVSVVGSVNEVVETQIKKKTNKSEGFQKVKSRKRLGFDLKTAIIYKTVLERKNF